LSEPTQNIVIVEGGAGGTITANLLSRRLKNEIRSRQVRVYLISGAKTHIFQPAYLHVAFKNQNPKDIERDEDTLLNEDVKHIAEDSVRLDLKSQQATLTSGTQLSYQHLVIATGSVANPSSIPGLQEGSLNFHTSPEESMKIRNALEHFEGGHLVVGIAGVPYKCPPSPNEAAFLVDDYFREHGIREKVKLTFVTPYPRPYPAEPMSKVVEPLFQKRGIEVVTFFNVESVDPANRKIYSLEGETLQYDLLIMVPPHRGADVVINSGIGDEDGWIPTDKNTMKIVGFENSYAIGDATNIPVSKTGVTAHLESIVAANNIVASIRGKREVYMYNGRINCPFEMGSGQASFVVGSYEMPVKEIQPSRLSYIMKKAFARFYWSTLTGSWDWLLNAYFGKTYKTEAALQATG
jgi:sulfide:quinone oxidoreductase